jgi:CRISPR-associated protein Csb3
MTAASIPVDLLNPGQVLASLGFLEAADVLCSSAVGAFDWTDAANARFALHTDGDGNPFEIVLEFLANATLHRIAPPGYKDPPQKVKKGKKGKKAAERDDGAGAWGANLAHSDSFPARQPDPMTLPVRLTHSGRSLDVTHWADGSSRNDFKLYAGNRSAATIARAMLTGTRETKGIHTLWKEDPLVLAERPFDVLTPMGGSFNFDPRGAWTALDAGYSPNDQKHGIAASPVVELLAAIGLEHARPILDQGEKGKLVRYACWGELLSPLLARPALSGSGFGVPLRMFKFRFALSGKNKVVNFAEGEI